MVNDIAESTDISQAESVCLARNIASMRGCCEFQHEPQMNAAPLLQRRGVKQARR
jgi:hypothetical protein